MTIEIQPAPASPTAAPGRRLPKGLAAFQHRNYRLFFAGQLISITGTWMQTMAQSWLMLSLTTSALVFSLVSVFQFLPVLALGMVAGVLADRFPKRKLLIITQSTSAVLALILAVLTATGHVQIWHVLTLALLLGIVNAFDMPTRQSFVVDMVGREDLMNAIALNSSVFNAGRIVGPAVAGLLLSIAGPEICFGVNAASYLAVIVGLLMMRLGPPTLARGQRGLMQMKEGLSYVRSTPILMLPVVLIGVVSIFSMNFQVWIPLLAKNDFKVGAGGFGLLMTSLGIGSLSGALFLAFFGRGGRPTQMLVSAMVLGCVEIVLAAYAMATSSPTPALFMLVIMGFTMSTSAATANTIVQSSSPEPMRGRVMSVYLTVFAGAAPAGSFLMGFIAEHAGTPISIMLGGSVTLVATLAVTRWFSTHSPDSLRMQPQLQKAA